MASAKKGKKNKGKTLALSDFLQETPGTVGTMPIRKSTTNWADEVEDNHDMYDSRSSKTTSVILPTAPKASRDFDDIIDKVPQDPPFVAYLTNLPYDVDENEISYFFRNMKIANMRIPKDDKTGEAPRLKGFGYVEFEDRDSLLNALVIPDTTIKNRRIRIEIATDYGNENRRGGRMDMNRDRSNRGDMSSFGDWRSGPRQETNDSERRGFSRDRDRDRDRDDNSSGAWRDGDRRAPSRDFNRDSEYNRPRGGRFESNRSTGGFTRNPAPSNDESKRNDEPRQRRKLLLTPRTKPVENEPEKGATSAAIFGNAKPVDTAARERQIEERLAKDNELPPARREVSRERKDESQKEFKKIIEVEKKVIEKEKEKKEGYNLKADLNGVVDKTHHQKRNGEHEKKETKGGDTSDKHNKPEVRKREEKKEKAEKEMPKLKKAEPPNFVADNKFAYLQNEDSSD